MLRKVEIAPGTYVYEDDDTDQVWRERFRRAARIVERLWRDYVLRGARGA